MHPADARALLDHLKPRLEPGLRDAFEIAASPEEGLSAVATLSLAISLKRIADTLDAQFATARGAIPVRGIRR